jgi:hypothetical protein
LSVVSRQRRRYSPSHIAVAFDALEERALLSGLGGSMGEIGSRASRVADMKSFGAGRQEGLFGGGSFGLGGGMLNPSFLLTAPLLDGADATLAPPSPGTISSTAVQTASQALQTDLKNDIPSGAQPTHASVGALQDDLDAIRKGTLSGTAAQTKIQSDQAAILSSMGLTQAQITPLQSDQTALQAAISAASSTNTAISRSTASQTSTTTSNGPASTVQTAMQTLQTDLQNDTPSGAQATHASIGAVQDDLSAIRKGTLTGSAATTQVQTDAAAVLSSLGLTAAQITQIQTDQQAVQTAVEANAPNSTSSTSTSSTTESTLQSASAYLIGIPGVSAFGTRGMDGGGFGGGFGGGIGGGFEPGLRGRF